MLSRPALVCAAAYVALELAEAFTQNAADALFLARHGAGGLGFVLAASSALVAVTVGLTGALADRGDRPRLFFRLGIGAAALLCAARGALALAPGAASVALLILAKQTSAALDLAFWVVVADRFYARQGRRLVPLLTFAGGAGMALGSFATRAVAGLVSVEGLLLVAAALTVAAAAALGTLEVEPSPPAAGVPLWTAWKEGAAAAARSPLYRRVVAVAAAVGAFGPILFTAFGGAAAAAHAGADDLAAFFGRFRGLTSLATLAAQAALGPAFFHFFGVGNAFLLAPLVGVVAGAALCWQPDIVVAAAALAAARVLDAAVQTPAEKLAQNLAAPRLRGRIGAFLDGVAKRSGALAGGIAVGLVAAPPLALAAAILWLAAALGLRRRYAALAVGELLKSPAPREALPAVDEATLRLLRRDLGGADPHRRELALQILAHGPDAVPLLLEAAANAPAARGRLVAALDRILEDGPAPRAAGLGEAALALLHDGDPDLLRANVVQAFGRLADDAAFARTRERLAALAADDPAPSVRLAAASALARREGGSRHAAYAEALLRRGRDEALGTILVEELRADLIAGGDPGMLINLCPDAAALDALADARCRAPEALDAARAVLYDPGTPPRARAAALRVLCDPSLLARALGDRHEEVREAARAGLVEAGLAALPVLLVAARFGRREAREAALEVARELHAPPSTWDDLIEAEVEELAALAGRRRALSHLGARPAGRLVLARLDERLADVARTLLLVLEVRLGDPAVGAAARGLGARDPRGRSRALEALDTLLPRGLALRVLPALDATIDAPGGTHRALPDGGRSVAGPGGTHRALPDGGRSEAGPVNDAVRAELDGPDALTRTLLVHAVGRTGRAVHRATIRRAAVRAADDIDPLRILRRIAQNEEENEEIDEMPSLAETMVALREIAPFCDLSPAELHELGKRVRWETRGEGEGFGEDDALWALVSGRASVDGAELCAPAVLGERALFGAGAAPRAVAAERTRLLHLSREDFEQAVDEVPGIALAVGRALLRAAG